jgi:hypothetical protein
VAGEHSVRALTHTSVILAFGALWGVVEGIWLVAPALIRDHRIIPTTLTHWVVLETTLLVMSAGLGALIAIFAAGAILGWAIVRRRAYRDAALAAGLALGSLLPLGYFGAVLLIEWKYFARLPSLRDWRLAVGVAAYVAGSLVLAGVYRRVVARQTPRPATTLAWILAALAVLGAATLPLYIPRLGAVAAHESPLVRVAGNAATGSPLLVVGVDSANWETIRPLLVRGSLPTIGRFVANGIHGNIEALWPPYWSAAAWAAILTGHPQEETGVYADLTVQAPGLPPFDAPLNANALLDPYLLVEWTLLGRGIIEATHPPRSVLHRPPVWELLSDAGVEAGVIRFDFSYPADERTSVVISNFVGRDNWNLARVRSQERAGLIAPAALRAELLAPFSDDVPFDDQLLSAVLPRSRQVRSARRTLEMKMLRGALDIDHRTFVASEQVLRLRPSLPFLGVYLPGLDEVCHAFWQYRFPEAYGDARPSAEDVAELGGVIDRYLEFLDRRLARLIGAFPSRPNVILVSDHGHEAILDHPLWRGWHSRFGVFIAEGPAFRRREEPLAVSYYDLVPTVADVMGFAVPTGMHGTTVRGR